MCRPVRIVVHAVGRTRPCLEACGFELWQHDATCVIRRSVNEKKPSSMSSNIRCIQVPFKLLLGTWRPDHNPGV